MAGHEQAARALGDGLGDDVSGNRWITNGRLVGGEGEELASGIACNSQGQHVSIDGADRGFELEPVEPDALVDRVIQRFDRGIQLDAQINSQGLGLRHCREPGQSSFVRVGSDVEVGCHLRGRSVVAIGAFDKGHIARRVEVSEDHARAEVGSPNPGRVDQRCDVDDAFSRISHLRSLALQRQIVRSQISQRGKCAVRGPQRRIRHRGTG
ncbi:hypothetical protein D3C73_920800 [compost metagenome]